MRLEILLKKHRAPLLVLLIATIFQNPLLQLYTSTVVKYITNLFTPVTWGNQIGLLLLAVVVLIFFIQKGRKHVKLPDVWHSWIAIVTAIYSYYRFFQPEVFTYEHFNIGGKGPALSDIVFCLLAGALAYWLGFRSYRVDSSPRSSDNGFQTDTPILIDTAADSNYSLTFIEELAAKLMATGDMKEAFGFAIVGKWGSGKTTFANTLLEHLKTRDQQAIFIKFNPWLANGTEPIYSMFFSDLAAALHPYDYTVSSDLTRYGKEFASKVDDKIGVPFLKFFSSEYEHTVALQKESIATRIKRINRRIIILIDDVDRLDKDEVLAVMKLVRIAADFKNTIFMVAFDKSYVVSCIRSVIESNPEKYLEKIFQLEYYLPVTNQRVYYKQFYEKLTPLLTDSDKELLSILNDATNYEHYNQYKPQLEGFIENYRDIKRLLNVFTLYYPRVANNVYLPDFINICLLRVKYPEVYYCFYHHYNHFLYDENKGENILRPRVLTLKRESGNQGDLNILAYLKKHAGDFPIPEREYSSVISLLDHIFPSQDVLKRSGRVYAKTLKYAHLTVADSRFLERYFDLNLNGRLDENEFLHYMNSRSLEECKAQVDVWCQNSGTATELGIRLVNSIAFTSRAYFEKWLYVVVYYADHSSPAESYSVIMGFSEYKFVDLFGGTEWDRNEIIKAFYEGNEKLFFEFLKSLFLLPRREGRSGFMDRLGIQFKEWTNGATTELQLPDYRSWMYEAFCNTVAAPFASSPRLFQYYREIIDLYNDALPEMKESLFTTMKEYIIQSALIPFLRYITLPVAKTKATKIDSWHLIMFDVNEFETLLTEHRGGEAITQEYLEFYQRYKEAASQGIEEVLFQFNHLEPYTPDEVR